MYPRSGAPLLPSALESILGDEPVTKQVLHRFSLPGNLQLRDLDERVWSEFPAASIEELARQVVAVTAGRFPEILASGVLAPIDPSGEDLSLRARNALFRSGLLGTPRGALLPLGELARQPGVGAKTLLEWLIAGGLAVSATEVVSKSESPKERAASSSPSRAVKAAADKLRRARWCQDIHAGDPRLGAQLARLHPRAETPSEAAELLAGMSFTPGAARIKARELREFYALGGKLRRLPLEDELGQILDAVLTGSKTGRVAVGRRLGFEGASPVTLEEAGRAAGLTRERVRQLELRFMDGVQAAPPWSPVLGRALKTLEELTPVRVFEAEQLLVEKSIVRDSFSIGSLFSAAQALDRQVDLIHDARAGLIYSATLEVTPQTVGREARRLTEHWGAATIDALQNELSDEVGSTVSPSVLRLFLGSVKTFEWLDDDRDWFWIRDVPRNRLLNQVEKVMSVAGSIALSELREGVGRWYRMEGFRPPREVLARLCEQSGFYSRDGDRIVEGPNLRPWERVLGGVERGIAEVLFEHGPVMRRDDLERIAVEERGLNRSSFYVNLGYSPVFARYAPGVYGLRGARITAAEVNALIPPRVRTQRLVDHGWTSDGRVWLGYKMSTSAVQAGVLSVPSALQEFVRGSYLLSSDGDKPVGTLVIKGGHMWGVGPFYRRWGVEENDYVVVKIDIDKRCATIAAGGEELLVRLQEAE
jgi:hypothetical protein